MQTLEENNRQVMKTISELASSSLDLQMYVKKDDLQRLLEEKNKSLSFFEFDLKLPYPAKVVAKSYPKDCTSPKFKLFNGKTSDACEHVMKFVETFGIAGLDDDLKFIGEVLLFASVTWQVVVERLPLGSMCRTCTVRPILLW
ncbi:hypothetical protein J1N35_010435 [Gossypium stocksii]|uniref:Uncharacterized protein n=1 Tax=Gossypium stocksii TaxID=47602 RepID=A0A9D3W142_9ROSI|nr:hypothetical protein J1N35_010435 [Gossypium stocksii]